MAGQPASGSIAATAAVELAGLITASRLTVAGIFDQAAVHAGGSYIDFKLVALGASDDKAAFAAAILKASERGFLGFIVKALVETKGLDVTGFKLGPKGDFILSSTLKLTPQELTPQDSSGSGFTPQGWKESMVGLISVGLMLPALVAASRRVCSVSVDNVKVGSGFLVGPQTVITNWHVAHTLIGDDGNAKAGSAKQLQCVFDYLDNASLVTHSAVEDWLVDWSPMAVGADTSVTGTYPVPKVKKPHALDYCIIRLGGAPGRARGWYDLAQAGTLEGGKRPFFVVQHPEQMAQRVAVTTEASVTGNQIRHMALTLGGSSGGLCLNDKFELVGLHQGQITKKDTNGKDQLDTNLAISAKAIGAECATQAASVVTLYDAIWITQRNRLAVVGRTQTLNTIAAMSDPATPTPILVVRGSPGAGKRFTVDLIDDRLAPPDRWIARLDASALPAGARAVADLILQNAQIGETERQTLSTPLNAGTTDIGWIREPLFREFTQLIAKAANGRLLWIVLENLSRIDIVPTAARTFLDVLYEKVAPLTPATPLPLRVVLLGLDGGVPTGNPKAVIYEQLRDPDQLVKAEIADFVAYVCAEQGLPTSTAEIDRITRVVMAASAKWPEGGPAGRLAKLGNLLSRIVYPELQGMGS